MNDNTLQNAIRNMRIERRLGKLSAETQRQTLLSLGYRPVVLRHQIANNIPCESSARWEGLMVLRQSIEIEIAPALAKRRDAEEKVFQYRQDIESRYRNMPVKGNHIKTPEPEPSFPWI